MKIPDYEYILRKVNAMGEDALSPIEALIYENEPSGFAAAGYFRKQVQAVVDEHEAALAGAKEIIVRAQYALIEAWSAPSIEAGISGESAAL